jgi:hypothetical protein
MFEVVSFLVSVVESLFRLVILPGQLLFVLVKFVLVVMLFLVAESLALLSLTVLFFREAPLWWIVAHLAILSAVRYWLKLLQAR